MKLPRRRFRTAASWSFHACPGRSAARSGALQTRDRFGPWRSRISDAPLRWRSRCVASGTHDTDGHSSFLSHDLQQHTLPRRGALLRERAFAAARAGWSDPCIFLFFCRFGSSIPGSYDLKQHALLPSRGACLRPGFASLLHSPRIEGWAERRETFGCSGTREACHNAARQALSRRTPLPAPPSGSS
jgi:hypothetical protein